MAEYLGSRISLLSNSDIRYVGTLHEISSENATVALENVRSFGTEGRRNGDDEIPPADTIYEYIVFRGSDVKDLRIEEAPTVKENVAPPQMPNDPAILGSGPRPSQISQQTQQNQNNIRSIPGQTAQPGSSGFQDYQQGRPPHFQGQPPFQYPYPPPPGRGFGPQGGPPGGPGFPGMPYGAPPGWYPPPGQGFHPGNYPPHFPPQGLQGPEGPHAPPQQQPQAESKQTQKQSLAATDTPKSGNELTNSQQQASAKLPTNQGPLKEQGGQQTSLEAPRPPLESKPSVQTALAPPAQQVNEATHTPKTAKVPATGSVSGRILPAVPIATTSVKITKSNGWTAVSGGPKQVRPNQGATNEAIENATQAATAAVAAAMAKLPPAPNQQKQQSGSIPVDNLTQKVNEMRTNDHARQTRQHAGGNEGPNGRGRGGRRGSSHPRAWNVDVPKTDYDFESANAKFNKQDLVKEAIATGSPTEGSVANGLNGASASGVSQDEDSTTTSATPSYNKSSSFFDNISSESKEREGSDGKRQGGRERRGEETKKNFETFGQGSVDNGHRGGFRGRSRGRGLGYRGRGGFGSVRGGRGGPRGPRNPNPTANAPTEAGA